MTSDEKFSKKEHLLKPKDFRNVYKNGFSERKNAVIFYGLANGLPHNRIGFSISSKNIREAAGRNRVKRLFREAYRKNKARLKAGFDIVLVVKKDPGKEASYERLTDLFLELAARAGLT